MPRKKSRLNDLPPVYRELLQAFAEIDPNRRAGSKLAVQTLYAHLRDDHQKVARESWSLSYVRKAIEELQANGLVELRNGIFVHPTPHGESFISEIRRALPAPQSPPPFPRELAAKPAG